MLRWEITGLWHPDGVGGWDDLVVYARPQNVADDEVVIPVNGQQDGQRTAAVTLELDAPEAVFARARKYMLRAFYFDEPEPVFWGAITDAERDTAARTVKLSAVDRSWSLIHHYLVLGDQALNSSTDATLPNAWDRAVPANGPGIQMLVDAAQNLAGHQADTYPPLGIAYGFDDTASLAVDTPLKAKFARGDQVWDSVMQLTPQEGSTDAGLPDVELSPTAATPGVYALLQTYARQGDTDPLRGRTFPDPIVIHAGWGKDNADVVDSEGGTPVTHAHVLSDNGKKQVTRASSGAATEQGVYTGWDQTTFNADDVALLELRGDETLSVSAEPTPTIEVTPKVGWDYRYLRDYIAGGTAKIIARVGEYTQDQDCRIIQVTLKTADQAGNAQELLTVLPTLGAGTVTDEGA